MKYDLKKTKTTTIRRNARKTKVVSTISATGARRKKEENKNKNRLFWKNQIKVMNKKIW